MSRCEQCTSPLTDGHCGTCGWVSPAALAAFSSAPAADLHAPSAEGGPPGRMAGATNMWTAALGPVTVLESRVEHYLVRFDNGREEWVPGDAFRSMQTEPPHPLGAQGLVCFSDGVDYLGRVAAVSPGSHRVRATDGREQWVEDGELQYGPFRR